MRYTITLVFLLSLSVSAQEKRLTPKPMELPTEVITGEFAGKIEETRPLLTYEFDPYLDVYRILGESYILDDRLEESIERRNGRLLTMQSNYLRVPVVSPLSDLTQKNLIIPIPPMEARGAVSWELVITDARGQIFKRITGSGRPPHQVPWNGRGDNGNLMVVGAIYGYKLITTDAVGNKERAIVDPLRVFGLLDHQAPGWVVSFDSREVFGSGGALRPGGNDYLQTIVNLVKEKSATNITITGYITSQTRVVENYIKERVPNAQIDIRKFGERYVNIDVALY